MENSFFFFFSSRRRHTRLTCDWSSDVCSSDLIVPASDACGEVVEIGEDVIRFAVGDRVTPTYIQGWRDGLPTAEQRTKQTLGAPLGGVLQDYIVVPAEDAVRAPDELSDVEASTLPIAGLTA